MKTLKKTKSKNRLYRSRIKTAFAKISPPPPPTRLWAEPFGCVVPLPRQAAVPHSHISTRCLPECPFYIITVYDLWKANGPDRVSTPITPQGAAKHHYNQQQSGVFVHLDANDLSTWAPVDGLVKGGHKPDLSDGTRVAELFKATSPDVKAPLRAY